MSSSRTIPLLVVSLYIYTIGCSEAGMKQTEVNTGAPGFSIKGVSMVAPVTAVDSTVLQPIISVHANSVSIMPYAFCSPENPEIKYNRKKQWWGENDDGVAACIKMAHQKGLSVMLKPHLWIARGMYTGNFTLTNEKDWKVWENSYRHYILHFAAIADSLKLDLFCIGTELGTAIKRRPQFWSRLIDTIRQVYRGKLTYAANWDDYQNFPFWEKLDYIGVDAYFPLVKDRTPSIGSLKKAWNKHVDALQKSSEQNERPVIFTEYGYRNVDNNSAEPWKEKEGNKNDVAQANAFAALYESLAGKIWFRGGYVWKWYVDTKGHHNSDIDYTPQGKAAEKVIEEWYRK